MAKKRQKFFWHVSPNMWRAGQPSLAQGVGNVGSDIVVELISTETLQSSVPENDNFVVERIIGQYMIVGDVTSPVDHFLHSRVYVAETDALSVALRTLSTADDAETSFLWHQVDPFPITYDGDVWGTWQQSGGGNPASTPWKGRQGHIDIKVGRRLEGGEALIWHTQIVLAPPANDDFRLSLWLRALVREG